MPLKTPTPKSNEKPAGKALSPSSGGKEKAAPAPKKKAAAPLPPEPVSINWWSALTDERKLDVVGAVMALVGLLTALILFSAQRSALTGSMLRLLGQMFGWGIYVLPIGFIVMGLWLIFRRIEKLPPLSLERATGLILFFLWLLAVLHTIVATPEMADRAALDGAGGGYLGSLFEKVLLNSFGAAGTVIVLLAWLLITVTMILDISVQDLFKWFTPLLAKIREWIASRLTRTKQVVSPEHANAEVASNGFIPLNRPEPVIAKEIIPGKPVTTVKPAEAVIQWQLPDIKQILDSGTAPSVNEEFIQQRGKLIAETLAAFGAPVQVVEINRGPTITQFGVEPLFVETRTGRTKVRVNKISSLADDLALALAAPRIRIQAPVPGHSYVGIEVAALADCRYNWFW